MFVTGPSHVVWSVIAMAGTRECTHADRRHDGHRHDERGDRSRVVIEMGGSNLVIRAADNIDHSYTIALADAVNAAVDTEHVVVIDPAPIRCDDEFTAARLEPTTAVPLPVSSPAVAVWVITPTSCSWVTRRRRATSI